MYSNLNNTDDRLLWKALIQGDDQAFSQLYDRYIPILYRYGLKMQPQAAIVEDAIQDLFVDVWRLKGQLSETDSVKFYLFRALRRRLHRAIREEEVSLQERSDEFVPFIGDQPSSEQMLVTTEAAQQRTERIQQWLDRLPARQQEALLLRYYQGFSYVEIADLLSINEQSARNLVQKALHKIRQLALLIVLVLVMHAFKFFF